MPDAPSDPRPTSLYRVAVPLRWSDMDAYGHVNNVEYLRLLEEARVEAFRAWFGDHDPVLLPRARESVVVGAGCKWIDTYSALVARSEIEYLRPLEFRHAPVAVDMWVTRLAGASYDLGYVMRDPESVGDQVYARAESTMVMYDFAGARPRRMTPEQRETLGQYLGEPVDLRRRR